MDISRASDLIAKALRFIQNDERKHLAVIAPIASDAAKLLRIAASAHQDGLSYVGDGIFQTSDTNRCLFVGNASLPVPEALSSSGFIIVFAGFGEDPLTSAADITRWRSAAESVLTL